MTSFFFFLSSLLHCSSLLHYFLANLCRWTVGIWYFSPFSFCEECVDVVLDTSSLSLVLCIFQQAKHEFTALGMQRIRQSSTP